LLEGKDVRGKGYVLEGRLLEEYDIRGRGCSKGGYYRGMLAVEGGRGKGVRGWVLEEDNRRKGR